MILASDRISELLIDLVGYSWIMALTSPATRFPQPLITFPAIVNDYAARTVATGVVALTATYVVTGSGWLLLPLVYGFWARVLAGPRFSPLGLFATKIVAPARGPWRGLPVRLVPGPPKRFAQGIGAALSSLGAALHLAGLVSAPQIVIGAITAAAFAEAAFGFCLGCVIFGRLMAAGVIPESVCDACNNLSLRAPTTARG